jgi:hypothetical protein
MDEVTSRAVRAESGSVKSAAEFRLVLRVSAQIAQLVMTVSKLTFVAILASASFFEGPTQLGLVMCRDGRR